MRKLLLIAGITAVAVPVLARPTLMASASPASTQAAAGTQAQAPGGGNPVGVLGPVNALGQEVKRPPAPTGPPPRLPDGTIDLTDGIWVSMPFGAGIAQGLKKRRSAAASPVSGRAHGLSKGARRPRQLVPAARCVALQPVSVPVHPELDSQEANPHVHPVGVDGLIPPDLHGWPPASDPAGADLVRPLDRVCTRRTPSSSTRSDSMTSSGSTGGTRRTPSSCIRSSGGRGSIAGHLVQEVTLDDPGAYSRPFTVTFQATLSPPSDDLIEYRLPGEQ